MKERKKVDPSQLNKETKTRKKMCLFFLMTERNSLSQLNEETKYLIISKYFSNKWNIWLISQFYGPLQSVSGLIYTLVLRILAKQNWLTPLGEIWYISDYLASLVELFSQCVGNGINVYFWFWGELSD